nr:helix-turn-helix transcriptional regulator [uncultured Neisseria sp.]
MPDQITSLLINVSQTIKYFRLQQKLSQEQLAQLADLDRTYISGIERGMRNLTINSLENIIKALNISYSDFFQKLITGEHNELQN